MKKLFLFLTIALLFTACATRRCVPKDYAPERTKAVRADHKGFY